jgi:acetyl-CoA carboxylase biotin carboxyl carrier protein
MADEDRSASPDVEAIRRLLELMDEHDLVELEMEQDGLAVRLKKAGADAPLIQPAPAAPAASAPPTAAATPQPAPEEPGEELPAITSPMVGTFYASSDPGADPYVKVGDHVSEDTVVCVIEAMKVFNEIRAETSGTIEQVLVKNAEAVEFGQPLLAIQPD